MAAPAAAAAAAGAAAAPAAPPARIALVLIDGVADVSLPRLGQRTPLQAARLPCLDAVAAAGLNGLMDPVEPGLACGSDTAHLSLLGYDPRRFYRGRGAFESMGAGLAMAPGDIAFKSNFATMDDTSNVVVKRRADRHFEREGPILCAALDGLDIPGFPECHVSVKYATEHRCGVVVKGPSLSEAISGTDPLKDGRQLPRCQGLDGSEVAARTAAMVNALSDQMRRILRCHPVNAERRAQGKGEANVVLLRGCGIRIEVPTFEDRHGLCSCMVAPTKIIAGLGLSLGIDILDAPGATGDYRTLLTSKATAIAAALSYPMEAVPQVMVPGEEEAKEGKDGGYNFGFLHIKAIDDAGHDKDPALKVSGLEATDRMLGQLVRKLWAVQQAGIARYTICITGDHSTPVEYGDHSFEPVPFSICHLADYVSARGGQEVVMGVSMDEFPLLQQDNSSTRSNGTSGNLGTGWLGSSTVEAFAGDAVAEFTEVAAARGCLGRFPGCEMMGIVQRYASADDACAGG